MMKGLRKVLLVLALVSLPVAGFAARVSDCDAGSMVAAVAMHDGCPDADAGHSPNPDSSPESSLSCHCTHAGLTSAPAVALPIHCGMAGRFARLMIVESLVPDSYRPEIPLRPPSCV